MDIGTGIAIASVCGVIIAAILKAPWKKPSGQPNGHITRKEFKFWLEGLNRWMQSVDGNIKDIKEDKNELMKV